MGYFGNLTSKATAPKRVAHFTGTSLVIQSFARNQTNGEYFAAQPSGANLHIFRCARSGAILQTMTLTGGGHGNSIDIEVDGADVYIWMQWGEAGNDGPLVRVKWTAGATLSSSDAELVHDFHDRTGDRNICFSIDQAADLIGIRTTRPGVPELYELRRLSDYKAGADALIASLSSTHTVGAGYGDFQGFAIDGGSGYFYQTRGGTGTSGDTSALTYRYSWNSNGAPDVMQTYQIPLLWGDADDSKHIESEGVQVVRDERGAVSVLLGVSTGPAGARRTTVYAYDPDSDDVSAESVKAAAAYEDTTGWRYFATQLDGNGGEQLLAGDIPLSDVSITQSLSATDQLTATAPLEIPGLEGDGRSIFVPWSTALYAECDGVIRAGGIVTLADLDGPTIQITAEGFSSYLHEMPYVDEKQYVKGDPLQIVRDIWSHVQSQDGSDIGVTLDFSPYSSPVQLGRLPVAQWPQIHDGYPNQPLPAEGTPFVVWWTENGEKKTRYGTATRTYSYPSKSKDPDVVKNVYLLIRDRKDGSVQEDDTNEGPQPGFDVVGVVDARTQEPTTDADGNELEPYILAWYQTFDLGDTVDSLASDTPFEYRERHDWLDENITHTIEYGYPTIGTKRPELRFVLGENVSVFPVVEVDGEDYADEVIVLGSGEGRAMIRGEAKTSIRDRLRRPKVITDKTQTSASAATRAAERACLQLIGEDIKTLVVKQHPNAPIGSFSVGDRIFVQGSGTGWAATLDVWLRVLDIAIDPASDTATLTVTRSERSPA